MTADSMEAYVMLITPDDGGEYTIESLQKALDDTSVIQCFLQLNHCRKHWMTEVSSTE